MNVAFLFIRIGAPRKEAIDERLGTRAGANGPGSYEELARDRPPLCPDRGYGRRDLDLLPLVMPVVDSTSRVGAPIRCAYPSLYIQQGTRTHVGVPGQYVKEEHSSASGPYKSPFSIATVTVAGGRSGCQGRKGSQRHSVAARLTMSHPERPRRSRAPIHCQPHRGKLPRSGG